MHVVCSWRMKAVCSVLCLVCHACCVFLEYEGSMHKSREWLWLHGGPGAGATFPLKDSMARSGTGVVGWQGGKGPTTQSWRGSAFQVSPSPKKKTCSPLLEKIFSFFISATTLHCYQVEPGGCGWVGEKGHLLWGVFVSHLPYFSNLFGIWYPTSSIFVALCGEI